MTDKSKIKQFEGEADRIPFRASIDSIKKFSDVIAGDKVIYKGRNAGIVYKKFSTMDSCIDIVMNEANLGRTDLLFLGVDDVSRTDMIVYTDATGKLRCYSYGVNGAYVPIDSK